MKIVTTFFLLMAVFCATALADGNLGNGGRANGTVRTATVKNGPTAEDDPPPPPPPPCVPSATVDCEGNLGNGGRPASVSIMIFFQKYVIGLFA